MRLRFDYAVAEGDVQESSGGDFATPMDDLTCQRIIVYVYEPE